MCSTQIHWDVPQASDLGINRISWSTQISNSIFTFCSTRPAEYYEQMIAFLSHNVLLEQPEDIFSLSSLVSLYVAPSSQKQALLKSTITELAVLYLVGSISIKMLSLLISLCRMFLLLRLMQKQYL